MTPPVYIYIARWFSAGKVRRLLWAMERSSLQGRKWTWSSYRKVFNFSGDEAGIVVQRLHAVYPASKIIIV